ncbi:MAG TPA: aldehyde dehydrogenase (NADP(+)), partial [Acidobacteriaceae bacterium]|nr:aldehyde dehydrogenase (NADP(+)) [Acidobacteriaceae bacterium]
MVMQEFTLTGLSIFGEATIQKTGAGFYGVNPSNAEQLEPTFYSATMQDVDAAATLAEAASAMFRQTSGAIRAQLLRSIAEGLTLHGPVIIERANKETGLPLPRLQGELGRTTGQLRLFAKVLEEGSWVHARIDEADRERKPLPRPDIRSMLRPLGPVAVFGASNFPLAFSVAGGDTSSALAAGNPVVVKAHPAHPGTSELVGKIIQKAVQDCGLPAGVFALLFDAGIDVGTALVQHPAIRAVAFTGSARGGQALMRLAAQRPMPIPCYAEMGSANPLFILSGAMQERSAPLAQGLLASVTLGSGQFCTKPGVVFLPKKDSSQFLQTLQSGATVLGQFGMLTRTIADQYNKAIQHRLAEGSARLDTDLAKASDKTQGAVGAAAIFSISLGDFLAHPELWEEVFGPTTLLVQYDAESDLLQAAQQMPGHLT